MLFRVVSTLTLLVAGAVWLSWVPEPAAGRAGRQVKLPVYFIENQGQVDGRVAYYVQGRNTAAYFTAGAVYYSLTEAKPFRDASLTPAAQAWVRLEFVGANPRPVMEPLGRTAAIVSYFRGPREEWKTGLPTYSGVIYRELWPGIDLEFAGPEGALKYTFHLRPGADPRQIRLAYRGANSVTLTATGSLHIETPAGAFGDDKPVAWQDTPSGRQTVAAAFQLAGEQVRFQLGAYDPGLPLTLDPVVLLYAGFLGGAVSDYGYTIAVDAAGNAYITGYTGSTQATFPVTVGPDLTHNSITDAFVAKVNAAGTALVYAGYLGGSAGDAGRGIAVDAAGNAYVTGTTNSTQATFPVTAGPDLTHNGGPDAFVAKVNATGTGLVYAGFLGGSSDDYGYGIAVDAAGSAYVTGFTDSTSFPVTAGPDLTHNGGPDAFVAKVNAAGSALVYSGFVGGSDGDYGRGIAVDTAGNAYVTGDTYSTEATFPVWQALNLTNRGNGDAFVVKVNPTGGGLVYAGFLGGSRVDRGLGIAVDALGHAYVTGCTDSNDGTFPVRGGPDLTHNGKSDAFVAKVQPTGSFLIWGGFLGGSDEDCGRGIAVDSAGNAYMTGTTYSANFPATMGPDLTYSGLSDGFVAKVNAAGTALVYSGYLGGSNDDESLAIAVDVAGSAYVTGGTFGTFPVTVGPDLTHNGSNDAFVAKIGAFSGAGSPTVAFRNSFNAIETMAFPSPTVRNSGGNFRLNPALAQSPAGTVFLAGRDSAAGVWVNSFNPNTETYAGWVFVGGNSTGQPAITAMGDDTVRIAVRDPWNSYHVRSYSPGTGAGTWTWLQGIFTTDPQISACPNGDIYVAGKDSWNGVWTRRYSASLAAWQPWRFMGGIISGAPALACGFDNVAYIAARDTANNMWLAIIVEETLFGWYYGQGVFQEDLKVVPTGDLIHVFGLSFGVPWYRTWETNGLNWLDWRSPGGVLTHFAPTVYGGDGTRYLNGSPFIAGKDAGGNLWWWSSVSNGWTNFGNKNVAAGSGFSAGGR